MAEVLADDLDRDAGGERIGGRAAPKIMESDRRQAVTLTPLCRAAMLTAPGTARDQPRTPSARGRACATAKKSARSVDEVREALGRPRSGFDRRQVLSFQPSSTPADPP